MAAWRYETSLLVLKKYFTRSLRSLVKYFSTLEEEFRISTRPCNILYVYYPQTHMQIFTPTVVQGGGGGGKGWMEPLPRVFDMLQYFETILTSVESL